MFFSLKTSEGCVLFLLLSRLCVIKCAGVVEKKVVFR